MITMKPDKPVFGISRPREIPGSNPGGGMILKCSNLGLFKGTQRTFSFESGFKMMTKEEKEWYDNIHKTLLERKSYDGMTFQKVEGGGTLVKVNIREALNQEKERNIFLNGQLFLEDSCNRIILNFFTPWWKSRTQSYCLDEFLSSRDMNFSYKINLLRILLPPGDSKDSEDYDYYPIDKKILESLTSIAIIRNYFHHKLDYYDALWHITQSGKGGAKFALIGRRLNRFNNFDEFINAYKEEVIKLYEELGKIIEYQERDIPKSNKPFPKPLKKLEKQKNEKGLILGCGKKFNSKFSN